jgi:uncharacterized protein YlaI
MYLGWDSTKAETKRAENFKPIDSYLADEMCDDCLKTLRSSRLRFIESGSYT